MLQKFNAWGIARVTTKQISVTLTAVNEAGKAFTKTNAAETPQPLSFSGLALIAVDILGADYILKAHELEETAIMSHPEIIKVLDQTVDWIRQSARL